jgi:hypothetical protein
MAVATAQLAPILRVDAVNLPVFFLTAIVPAPVGK